MISITHFAEALSTSDGEPLKYPFLAKAKAIDSLKVKEQSIFGRLYLVALCPGTEI